MMGFTNVFVLILPVSVNELKGFYQSHVFGKVFYRLRAELIRKVVGPNKEAESLRTLRHSESNKKRLFVLNSANLCKDLFFSSLAMGTKLLFLRSNRGTTIYFHAKYEA